MINCRLATDKDIPVLVALDTVVSRDPSRARQIAHWCIQNECYILEDPDTSIAQAYGVLNYHFFGCGFIEMVMVGEHARRQGLGRALIGALEAKCDNAKLFSSTNESNVAMRRLLEQQGFVPSGRIENLDEGDPEVVYFKGLGT